MAQSVRGLTARIIREGVEDESVFIAENHFYCYLIKQGSPPAVLQVTLQKVQQEISEFEYENGAEFEEKLKEAFKKAGADGGLNVACIYNQNDTLFIATQEQGEVFIQRGGKTMKLLDGNKYAAGRLQDEDAFILTSRSSSLSLHTVGGWNAYLDGTDISGHDASGLILTTSVVSKEDDTEPSAPRVAKVKKPREPSKLLLRLQGLKTMDRRRALMFGGMGVIALLLVASLIFGLIRRANDNRSKQIAITKEEVTQKLQQAEDVAFLNSGRAAGLINDAKHDVQQLKEKIGDDDSKEMKELSDMIAAKEAGIFKKEEKKTEEFFDLGIEDKNARGKLFARNGDRSAIVNPDGSVYLLNLQKKSLDKQSSGVKDATAVAVSEDSVFVLGSNGIVQIDEDGKAKKILDKDKDWGKIVSFVTFNKNLYVLDGGKGLVYKYTPTADGYGGKTSYVKGDAPSLVGATSIAVDSSVYVALPGSIIKFTSGLQEGFAPQFPDEGTTVTKVDSSDDVEKVYAWDKPKGAIYIMSKNGSYERQIKTSALKSADDVVVTSKEAYLLQGQKIYKIGLE